MVVFSPLFRSPYNASQTSTEWCIQWYLRGRGTRARMKHQYILHSGRLDRTNSKSRRTWTAVRRNRIVRSRKMWHSTSQRHRRAPPALFMGTCGISLFIGAEPPCRDVTYFGFCPSKKVTAKIRRPSRVLRCRTCRFGARTYSPAWVDRHSLRQPRARIAREQVTPASMLLDRIRWTIAAAHLTCKA